MADSPLAAIEVRGLTKEFRSPKRRPGLFGALAGLLPGAPQHVVRAVDGLSLAIEPGEFVGLLGPNGAGKSTTVKLLTGILYPTAGEARVRGLVPWRQREDHARQIGVVFGQRTQLWWDLPVADSLDMLRRIYEVPWPRYRANLKKFDEVLGVGEFLHVPARRLSLGQRVRSDLAAALLHDPPVIFLDEPTVGVDLLAKDRLRTFLRELNRDRGVTILLTTHDMTDLEKLCRRIVIIDHGRLVYDGSLEDLRRRLGTTRALVVHLAEDDPAATGPVTLPEGAWLRERAGRELVVEFDRDRLSAAHLLALLQERHAVEDLAIQEPDVEQLVKRVYLGELPAAERERGPRDGG